MVSKQQLGVGKSSFNLNLWVASTIIISLGACVFFNALFGNFLIDDIPLVQQNPYIHSIKYLSILFSKGAFYQNGTLTGRYYRPILTVLSTIIWSQFGDQPFFFHLAQVSIHVLNSILLFIFFRKLFKQKLALFLALIFLVHPINVEAVSYISAMQEPLFFLFGISSVILSMQNDIRLRQIVAIGILLLCSMLSKETGILFVFMTFVCLNKFSNKKYYLIRNLVITITPVIIYAYLRFSFAKIFFERNLGAPILTATLIERMTTVPAIFLYYIKTFLYPKNLAAGQFWLVTKIGTQFYIPLLIDIIFLVALGLLGVFIYQSKRVMFKTYVFFLLWFLVGISFHLQIYPLDMTLADRWFYFPIVGILGILGILFSLLNFNQAKLNIYASIVASILLIILSVRTIIRNANWHDALTLAASDVKMINDPIREQGYAQLLWDKGMRAEALPHFIKAIELDPENDLCGSEQTKKGTPRCKTEAEALQEYFGIDQYTYDKIKEQNSHK